MRLTLRTVLAYLDDVLEPSEAREIGQKISESKEASALVAQIREAIRRRRIGAPELAGPGSGPDPNIVSEYLENVLPANQVVEFEQLCRRSEVHLAEVAACHKVLTMVMGQPIEVSDQLKERMYELGASKAPPPTHPLPVKSTPQMTSGMGTQESSSFSDGLPEYLTRGKNTSKIWTTLIVVLMAGAWVALVVSDKSIWTTQPEEAVVSIDEKNEQATEDSEVEKAADNTTEDKQQSAETISGVSVASNNQSEEDSKKPTASAPVSVNPPPPPESVATTENLEQPKLANNPDMKVPPKEIAKATPPQEAPSGNKPPAPKPPNPAEKENVPQANKPAAVALTIIPPERVAILRPNGAEDWIQIEQGNLSPGDQFATPIPFKGELTVGDDLIIQLLPGSRIERIPGTADIPLRVALHRGRVLFKRPVTALHPTKIEVQLLGRSWTLNFEQEASTLAIEVILPQPEGLPENSFNEKLKTEVKGGLGVIKGAVKFQSDDKEPQELTVQNGWLEIPKAKAPLNLQSIRTSPSWSQIEEEKETPAKRQLALAYQKEFDTDILKSIAPIVNDRRPSISEFATQTMVLTDQILEVIPALHSDHEETRFAAIIGIRQWLLMDEENAVLLKEEMERQLLPEAIEVIIDLLWGFTQAEAQSPEVSLELVEQLGNEDLAIRELAHFHVTQLSGRNYGYHAQAPVAERRAAIGRWLDFLKREESLVKPE